MVIGEHSNQSAGQSEGSPQDPWICDLLESQSKGKRGWWEGCAFSLWILALQVVLNYLEIKMKNIKNERVHNIIIK